ncbi:polymorphic toxin type 44 domain-containing protein [Lactococcus protaetiae]|uniref:LXG domain-containing protein n=1 Tax=Lactococcus protaetiae TaxID=2592653 RepID=A0A514Z812_9LACT|nr:polymorphic toxin type 44 domain-containing protein [Lactococcus protaetiae]QDK70730.1 hypothetical protein FLP15_05645 [Lactococcus protaetiae]
MGLKYNKNDGELLLSALTHNVQSADEIIRRLQTGVNYLTWLLDNPFSGLSGKAYNAANTLFKGIIQTTLDKLEQALTDIKSDSTLYHSAIGAFNAFNDTIFDEDKIQQLIDIKRQQLNLVENQIIFFNDNLVNSLAKGVAENLLYEGKQLESVASHYQEEIVKLEAKLQILQEFSWKTSSLFQDSLQVFQNAMQGAKALNQGNFDKNGNFKIPTSANMTWYKAMIGQELDSSLVAGDRDPNTLPEKYRIEIEDIKNSNLSEVEKADKITNTYEKYLYSLAKSEFNSYNEVKEKYLKGEASRTELDKKEALLSEKLQSLNINIKEIAREVGNNVVEVSDKKNLVVFYDMVQTKHPLDLKNRTYGNLTYSIWSRNWNNDLKIDGKDRSTDYLGNYLYGYYGKAMGFSNDILLNGAGTAQTFSNLSKFDFSFGDNAGDSEIIKQGIKDFEKK